MSAATAAPTIVDAPQSAVDFRLDRRLVYAIVAVVLAPGALMLLGIDFSSHSIPLDTSLSGSALTDGMFRGLQGAFTHTLLEWSAFCVAVFTACLAFAHFMVKRNLVTPVIALALVAAGVMDAFHTFAADRLIDAAAANHDLIPFTWAICRLFNSVICMLGVAFFLLNQEHRWGRHANRVILAAGVVFSLSAYAIISLCASSPDLPQTQFPGAWITRPWDVGPFLIFLVSSFLFVALYRKQPSIFLYSLVLSTVPDLATQAHMALGSSALFDAHFNVAHFLKIVAYATPCLGLLADYVRINRSEVARIAALASINDALMTSRKRLERSNADLQHFAYIASHDLKAPLRAITSLVGFIRDDIDDPEAQDDVHQHLDLLGGRASRMSSLIDGILSYSALDSGAVDTTDVDIRELVHDIGNTELPLDCPFALELAGPMPVVHTNRVVLRQVFANLVTNAMKHHDRGRGIIVIRCDEEIDGYVGFSVRDDGPGIAPEFHERIFGIFQTLKPRDEFESTGIGLSLVRKLVLSVGGSVRVESTGERGTTFRFTWPIGEPDSGGERVAA